VSAAASAEISYLGQDVLARPYLVAAFLTDTLTGHHPGNPTRPVLRCASWPDDFTRTRSHYPHTGR
jgi:hypothetical protein